MVPSLGSASLTSDIERTGIELASGLLRSLFAFRTVRTCATGQTHCSQSKRRRNEAKEAAWRRLMGGTWPPVTNKGLMDAPKASAAHSRLAHQLIQLGGRQSTVLVLVEVVEKRTQPCISAASRRHNQQYSRVLTASSGHRLAGLLAVSAIASGPAPKCTG